VSLSPGELALLAGAGLGAGAVNAVAGGGSLISFPALLAIGYPSVAANVTNSVAGCRATSAARSATGRSSAASGGGR